VWTCLAFGGSAIDIAADIETVVPPRTSDETADEPPTLFELVLGALKQLAELGLLRITIQ
jgi:hypothetical protein